jgi:predicted GIY-YIG superfamily endonuclease
VNPQFAAKVAAVTSRYLELAAAPLLPLRGGPSHSTGGGIYVLYEADQPVHVGRTRNLRRRLQGHCSQSHHQASFAFKRARAETGKRADYKAGNSRTALAASPDFRPAFLRQVQAIRQMAYRFLPVADPVEQYLLELYTAMELGTSMDEFDTH